MVDVNFSFRPEKKPEKYPDTPVLTYIGDEGIKKARKFHLNKKALELLNYDIDQIIGRKISIARNGETKTLLLINSTSMDTSKQISADVTSQDDFANVKFLDKVNSNYDLNLTFGDEILLSKPEIDTSFGVLVIVGLMEVVEESKVEVTKDADISPVDNMPEPTEDNF